ncbi:MAG: AtpZ/AtpI family protein [Thermoanaerobaculia bacterium]|nr:AtpZ/AtpI family protein [Thermoanaerobaculia bacterium]MCZ7652790.1 AtpZ/AtpI family protein [Thermoanaerobaculia bacterium]
MPLRSALRSPWMRLANAGFELAAAIGGFALLGWWVDRQRGSQPWGVLIGALLGLVGGLYNLIKASLRAAEEAEREDDRHRE